MTGVSHTLLPTPSVTPSCPCPSSKHNHGASQLGLVENNGEKGGNPSKAPGLNLHFWVGADGTGSFRKATSSGTQEQQSQEGLEAGPGGCGESQVSGGRS